MCDTPTLKDNTPIESGSTKSPVFSSVVASCIRAFLCTLHLSISKENGFVSHIWPWDTLDLKSPAIDAFLTTRPPCAQSHTADGTRVKASSSTASGHEILQDTGPLVLKRHVPPLGLEAHMHNELLWLAQAHMPWTSHPEVIGQGEK